MATNILTTLVNASFLLFLLIITTGIVKSYLTKNITSKDIERQKIVNRVGIVIISTGLGIVLVIILIVMSTGFKIIQEGTYLIG